MPAIQPARLKSQVQETVEHLHDPAAFLCALHDLLNFYADRTRRFQRGDRAMSLIKNYRVPDQVLLHIERGLIPALAGDPERTFPLADTLWEDGWLETRLLAVTIVGQIAPDDPGPIADQIRHWSQVCKDPLVIKALSVRGLERLRRERRDFLLATLEDWLSSPDAETSLVRVALRAFIPLLEDERFENLPLVFRLLTPLARQIDFKTRPALAPVIGLLAQRSPQETSFFLRKLLTSADRSHVPGLIREILDQFPAHLQDSLRQSLRENRDF